MTGRHVGRRRPGDRAGLVFARIVVWVVAAFYAYGALIHVLNIAGLSGFDWPAAPLKWQVLDIVYLVLDLLVVVGLLRWWRFGFVAFFIASLSQIALYTLLRPFVVDVPADVAPSPEQVAYLDWLVAFHIVTISLVSAALILRRRSDRA